MADLNAVQLTVYSACSAAVKPLSPDERRLGEGIDNIARPLVPNIVFVSVTGICLLASHINSCAVGKKTKLTCTRRKLWSPVTQE